MERVWKYDREKKTFVREKTENEDLKKYINDHEEQLKELFKVDVYFRRRMGREEVKEEEWEEMKEKMTMDGIIYVLSTCIWNCWDGDRMSSWNYFEETTRQEYEESFGKEVFNAAFKGFKNGDHDT